MSRGYGTQQRRILAAVSGDFVWLASLAPDTNGAEYKALHRAARRLAEKGDIAVYRYGKCSSARKVLRAPQSDLEAMTDGESQDTGRSAASERVDRAGLDR
jgi:hypothetical protein